MKPHRILLATDVPFWRRSNGAEQRIASIVRFLLDQQFQVRIFYLGQQVSGLFTEEDAGSTRNAPFEFVRPTPEKPPHSLAQKLRWYAQATTNQLTKQTQLKSTSPRAAMRLADFEWPWAKVAFYEEVNAFKPQAIIVEYVKLTYLIDSLPTSIRNATKCLLDSHDVLHLRNIQFRNEGFTHWIDISRDEETKAFKVFDAVIAIQSTEADLIQSLAPEIPTLTCGHALDSLPQVAAASKWHPKEMVRVGYLGSKNASNTSSLKQLIQSINETSDLQFQLTVGGSICDWLTNESELNLDLINWVGRVDSLEQFYEQIDIVVNPVEFGTGLKIKNIEALAYGKPLITTMHGITGIPESLKLAVRVVQDAKQIVRSLNELCEQTESLEQFIQTARELPQREFSPDQVYKPLLDYLITP